MSGSRLRREPGVALIVVLWALAVVLVMLAPLQLAAWSEAAAGREALGRVRATWAARAGVETVLARIEDDLLAPDRTSALRLNADLERLESGTLAGAGFTVRHCVGGLDKPGPLDASGRINVNTMTVDDLLLLPDMSEEIAESILDWIDADDDPRELGAEREQYAAGPSPCVPRNGPVRSLQELELVTGVEPIFVRGEDWNLNGRLDPNENDGDASPPADNADGRLDAGWSAVLSAGTADPGYGLSGEPLLDLRAATSEEVSQRLDVDGAQAEAIIYHVQTSGGALADFLATPLAQLAEPPQQPARPRGRAPEVPDVASLDQDQLAALLDECTVTAGDGTARPGRLNINTCEDATLEYLSAISPAMRDGILYARASQSGGFLSLMDLLEVPSVDSATLARLEPIVTTRSGTFTVAATGRDQATGIEVSMTAVLDRSTLPATIADLVLP